MSENVIAVLVSFVLLLGMFFWVPLLEIVCPPCSRLLWTRWRGRGAPAEAAGASGEHSDAA